MSDYSGSTLALLLGVAAVILAAFAYNPVIPTNTYISAYSNVTQTILANNAANVRHDIVSVRNGIELVTGTNSYFLIKRSGIYKIIPSIQFKGTNKDTIYIWIKVNGVNVPDTTTATVLQANNEEGVITTEYLLSLNKNDTIQVWAFALTRNWSVNVIAATDPYPQAPGIITNMYALEFT